MMEKLQLLFTLTVISCLVNRVVCRLTDPSFRDCRQFFHRGNPPSGLTNPQTFRYICQTYANVTRFAGLYSTTHRIPLYSAYTLHPDSNTRPQPERPRRWFIEPELSNIDEPNGNMLVDSTCSDTLQATEPDYRGQQTFDRGHMNPNSYHHQDGRTATFTLTNVVPQAKTFNQGSWSIAEGRSKDLMMDQCTGKGATSYFVTGAIPGTDLLNGRVNIPTFMWTAAVCDAPQANVFVAYYGPNVANAQVTHMGSTDDLQNLLRQRFSAVYESTFEIFPTAPSTAGTIVPSRGRFSGITNLARTAARWCWNTVCSVLGRVRDRVRG